jgi:hypothetical protein
MEQHSGSHEPSLERAQATLEVALKQACSTDVRGANTGELIRIDEMLAIAGEAAKEVISVRRRIGRDRRGQGVHANHERSKQREFDDGAGVRWKAFAVYPAPQPDGRPRLPESFQDGWLSFDSGTETRRLSPIPDGWQELAEQELLTLCQTAQPAMRRQNGKP